ncbi:MAG: GNAT family N-acetyltransferase [Defluviitaleaceae bacterium]|nr:GNAT family N-acetyltransferase [Defluviitaleaceae bacterium]
MITYRKATAADSTALTQIRMENMAPYNQDASTQDLETLRKSILHHFESSFADGSFITWLACDGDNIIATSGLTFFRNTPSMTNLTGKTGYITNMYTRPEYRRRGIGSKLFSLTMKEAVAQGCGRLVLYGTPMANTMYKKLGFEDCAGYMTYVPPAEIGDDI